MSKYTEATEVLERNKPTSDPRECGRELCNAVDVAIKALQIADRLEQADTFSIACRISCKNCEADCDGETLHHAYPCQFICYADETIKLALADIRGDNND